MHEAATSTMSQAPSLGGTPTSHQLCGGSVPPGSPAINNYNSAGNAINPVTYQGVRVSALWQIDDDWNLLLAQTYQDIDAQASS